MKPIADCTEIETNFRICREEESKVICFEHDEYPMVCAIIGMDSCVFAGTVGEQSCDYLFLFDKHRQDYNFLRTKKSIAFYVELKGIDLEKACKQLYNSINKTMNQIEDYDINAIVVSSREFVPRYDNTESYRDTKRLIRKNIEFKLTPHTINLSD